MKAKQMREIVPGWRRSTSIGIGSRKVGFESATGVEVVADDQNEIIEIVFRNPDGMVGGSVPFAVLLMAMADTARRRNCTLMRNVRRSTTMGAKKRRTR